MQKSRQVGVLCSTADNSFCVVGNPRAPDWAGSMLFRSSIHSCKRNSEWAVKKTVHAIFGYCCGSTIPQTSSYGVRQRHIPPAAAVYHRQHRDRLWTVLLTAHTRSHALICADPDGTTQLNGLFVAILAAGAIAAAPGCVAADGPTGTIQIGGLLSLSGSSSSSGGQMDAAVRLAVDDFNSYLNRSGALWSLEWVLEDIRTDPDAALDAIQSMNSRSIGIVIGPDTSAALERILDYVNNNGMLLVSPSVHGPKPGHTRRRGIPAGPQRRRPRTRPGKTAGE